MIKIHLITNCQTCIPPRNVILQDEVITPQSIEITEQPPYQNVATTEDKCQFVRRQGGSLGDNCMKGGMSCQKKCEYSTAEPVCTQQLTVRRILNRVGCNFHLVEGCLRRCSRSSLWNCQWKVLPNCSRGSLWWSRVWKHERVSQRRQKWSFL